jgi:hypothetical protein
MTPEERMNVDRCWNDTQRQELNAIAKDGCAAVKVLERNDPRAPEWAYTVGLHHSYGHPEILIIGLENELTQVLLQNINSRIRDKSLSFRHGTVWNDVIVGYDCYFQRIDPVDYGEWFAANRWFYGDNNFEAVQMLWPSVSGIYPWQSEADPYLRWDQPMLTVVPKKFLS